MAAEHFPSDEEREHSIEDTAMAMKATILCDPSNCTRSYALPIKDLYDCLILDSISRQLINTNRLCNSL